MMFHLVRSAARVTVPAVWLGVSVFQSAVVAQCGEGGDYSGECVRLEFRPAHQSLMIGEATEIGLYAVSVNSYDQPIKGLDVLFVWDSQFLAFAGNEDPCDSFDPCFVCPPEDPPDIPATYNWFWSCFHDDSVLDGFNAGCEGGVCCPAGSPIVPDNDGDAYYLSFMQSICGGEPAPHAYATPDGLLVTTFRFDTLADGAAEVGIAASCEDILGPDSGCFTQTRVIGGPDAAAIIVTGPIGPPAAIEVFECPQPAVEAKGSRYLAVTPLEGPDTVALYLTGVDVDVSCVSGYVRADGRFLQDGDPVYLPPGPDGWDMVHVHGEELIGSMTYSIEADCDPGDPGTNMSDPVEATLWRCGDVNNNGVVDFVDITMIVDGFRNVFGTPFCCSIDEECSSILGPLSTCNTSEGGCTNPPTPGRCRSTIYNLDIMGGYGCTTDRVIDFVDITTDVDAFQNRPDPCRGVCP